MFHGSSPLFLFVGMHEDFNVVKQSMKRGLAGIPHLG